ncbi:glycosyltransferase [Leptospira gomenensis]|uniref:Glycosyltransferase n=1 Tax=Leptospira gomenensis TaxID=2484974 RepID=A0A5F1YSS3_9LEPT|nr:glycosyltransferase [Leptospira gomenensis]TGK30906.1 glycosyltransferase [Leptospira gomenensis]TGK32544.1 glycosyltransferase [Leptospira gomenensis]TGK45374.1 glycosyltransferase [Leptospira gomenensis]TGK60634.1 glycosyltransferase [Leptospira gomenensis]
MKVCLVGTNDSAGGAAKAMYRIHRGLLSVGVSSNILCRFKNGKDDSVEAISRSLTSRSGKNLFTQISLDLIHSYLGKNRTSVSNTLFSYPYPGVDIFDHPIVRGCDVVNLHWVSYFLSPINIHNLLNSNKPIVWTLHDESPYTGGCHYTAGCDRFGSDCAQCPQILSDNSTIPKSNLADKIELFSDRISVIAPSRWIYKRAKSSAIFKNSRITCIPNPIDAEIYNPYSREQKRHELGFSEDVFVLLFGANSAAEKRKGFTALLSALRYCNEDESWRRFVESGKIHFLFFGNPAEELKNLNIPYTDLGAVENESALAEIYSAADVFVLPSLEDNLPNTMLESLACETPVIAFPIGGVGDVVEEGVTGYLSDGLGPEALALKILESLKNSDRRKTMGKKGREIMLRDYSYKSQAERYVTAFSEHVRTLGTTATSSKYRFDDVGPNTLKNWKYIKREVGFGVFDLSMARLLIGRLLSKIVRFRILSR